MRQDAFFHHARPPPLPNEAPYPPILAPLSPSLAEASPVQAIDGSTDIRLHDPASARIPAPLASFASGRMRATTLPKALRAVRDILRIDRFQPPRHRSPDHLVLKRGLADRASAAIILLAPPTLDRRCLGHPAV